jgi:nicotinate-nucleotide adenylyltransferase
MRLGLFGGSFDPIHWGHIRPVLEALEAVPLDRVLYLPTADPPHKPDRERAAAHARYTMVELALLDHDRLLVSDHELTPGKVAYTVDTVRHFQQQHPDDRIHLLIGADSFCQLHRWRRWEALVDAVELVVLRRPGWSLETRPASVPREVWELLDRPGTRVVGSLNDLSSTEVRRRLHSASPTSPEVVPAPVLRYIHKYALYGSK